jgi:hypothetical protein
MKITKSQLRRIIKEEKRKLLREMRVPDLPDLGITLEMIHQALDDILDNTLKDRPVEELERIATDAVTGPGGLDEPTQALARIALSMLSDGGHHRGS